MKTIVIVSLILVSFSAVAGGGRPPEFCKPVENARVVLKAGSVLDRGGHFVSYRIVMEGDRCQTNFETRTVKRLYLHYDAPVLRSKRDGFLMGDFTDFSKVKADKIFTHFTHRVLDETVTEHGLKMQIGATVDDNNLPVDSIPAGFKAGSGAFITVFGNAFPTHTIEGPFLD